MDAYVLLAQGLGDGSEDEFVIVGVYTSRINLEIAERNLIAEGLEDDLEIVTDMQVWEMDA